MREAGRTWAEIEGSPFRVFNAKGQAVKPSGRAMRRALARQSVRQAAAAAPPPLLSLPQLAI